MSNWEIAHFCHQPPVVILGTATFHLLELAFNSGTTGWLNIKNYKSSCEAGSIYTIASIIWLREGGKTLNSWWDSPGIAGALPVQPQTLPVFEGRPEITQVGLRHVFVRTERQVCCCSHPALYCFRAFLLVLVSSLSNTDFFPPPPPPPVFWLAATQVQVAQVCVCTGALSSQISWSEPYL